MLLHRVSLFPLPLLSSLTTFRLPKVLAAFDLVVDFDRIREKRTPVPLLTLQVPGLVACGDTDDALFGVVSDDDEIAMTHIEKLVNKKSRLHKSFQSVILLHFF